MSVEELVKRLRDGCNLQQRDGEVAANKLEELDTHRRKVLAENERLLYALIEANRKLAELAAENERWRERVEANNEWRKAYNELTVKAEAALAEKDKELAALRQALRNIAEGNLGDAPWQANYEKIREVARNAGGKDGE